MIHLNVLGTYSNVIYPIVSKKATQVRTFHTMRLNVLNSCPHTPKVRVGRILGIPVQGPSLFERLRGKS